MTLLRNRQIAGAVSVLLLLVLSHLLGILSSQSASLSLSYIDAIPGIIFGFVGVIFLAWAGFGVRGGVLISLSALVAVFFTDFRMGLHGYSIYMAPLILAAFVGSRIVSRSMREKSMFMLNMEKLGEESNLLENNMKERESGIRALEEKLKRYSTLKEVAESLSTVLALEPITKLIVNKLQSILAKDGRILLFIVDADKQELMLASSVNAPKVKTKRGDPFDQWILRHRKTLMIEDVQKDFRFPARDLEEASGIFRSLVAAPLVSENKIIGVLRMDSSKESSFVQDDLRILGIIADLGAVAVQNALLYSRTEELAIRDGLTGMFVRRYFAERFHEELKRAARKKMELAIAILDIDRFKDYNDKFGHTAGDMVLRHLSRIVMSMVREGDIVARYGGEEVVVLLYGRTEEEARVEAEGIRKAIEEKPLTIRRQKTGITVSIGLSMYPKDGSSEEELVRVADERLYKAKRGGRNKLCSG